MEFQPYWSAAINNIRIDGTEDVRLRRILLEPGESFGNCVVRLQPKSDVQHTRGKDVEIAGRVKTGRRENAVVNLIVFTLEDEQRLSADSDNKGRFQFMAPAAGDIRLRVGIQDRSGNMLILPQEVNLGWAELGDRITIPEIKLNKSGLGHFCY